MTVQKIIDEYLFYCDVERGFSQHTLDAYRSDLDYYFRFIGHASLKKALTVDKLKSFLAYMLKDRALSLATARRRIASLRGFRRYLEKHGIENDPFRHWSPSLKRPKRLPRALSRKVVKKLVQSNENSDAIDGETVFCMLILGATGIRVSELCALRVRDVSADGASIHIAGKGAKDRIVYVGNKDLCSRIANRRNQRAKQAGLDEPFLLNSRNMPLKPQTMRRRLHRVAAACGLKDPVTPHRFRHTAATMLLERGTDIRFVQRQLGHSSISTTELYTHVTDAALKKAISKADPIAGLVA